MLLSETSRVLSGFLRPHHRQRIKRVPNSGTLRRRFEVIKRTTSPDVEVRESGGDSDLGVCGLVSHKCTAVVEDTVHVTSVGAVIWLESIGSLAPASSCMSVGHWMVRLSVPKGRSCDACPVNKRGMGSVATQL